VLAVAGYWLLVVGFQYAQGAWTEPFGGHADEPAHYMSGLMVRDYMAAGFPATPIAYATNYYTHLPYLAIGYWPPLFYVIEGVWMRAFGSDRNAVLLLCALIAAAAAGTCFSVLTRWMGAPAAFITGLLLLITPAFQWSDCLVMVDILLALLCLWSGLALAAWAMRPSAPRALLAGLLVAAALLTKINSIYLAAVIPLFLLLTRRWDLLRKASFWIIPAVALAFWLPWILNTRQFVMIGFVGLARPSISRLLFGLGTSLLQNLQWLLVPVTGGLIYVWKNARNNYLLIVCCVLLVCYAIFLPVAGVDIEYRFLTPILTPAIIIAGFGLSEAARELASLVLPSRRLPAGLLVPLVATVCVSGFAATTGFHWHKGTENTIDPVVLFLEKQDALERSSVLVPSSAEGPFIAQFAMRDRKRPGRLVVRPTKLLASETWSGASYRSTYRSADEVEALLDRFPLRYVILTSAPVTPEYAHDPLLRAAVEKHPERWTRVNMPSASWVLYERNDGRTLPDSEMEKLAREALLNRLRVVGQ
jgi:hypothetical protein